MENCQSYRLQWKKIELWESFFFCLFMLFTCRKRFFVNMLFFEFSFFFYAKRSYFQMTIMRNDHYAKWPYAKRLYAKWLYAKRGCLFILASMSFSQFWKNLRIFGSPSTASLWLNIFLKSFEFNHKSEIYLFRYDSPNLLKHSTRSHWWFRKYLKVS